MKSPCENMAGRETEDPRITAARIELRAFVDEMTILIDKKLDLLAQRIARNDQSTRDSLGYTNLLDAINKAVATEFKIEPDLLYSQRRTERVVIPRQTAMYLARRLTRFSLNQIGEHWGRDHGTVLHAIGCTQERLDTYPAFKLSVESLELRLKDAMTPLDPIRAVGINPRSTIPNPKSK